MSIPMIGDPRDRVDGRAKVTGSAKYAAEYNVPGIVHAVVVPATIASGTISAIDTAEAKKATGVIAIISHLNAPKVDPQGGNFAEPHLIPFTDNSVHYVGQQIVVVVADTLEHATHAAELVKVKYSEQPARTDMDALRNEAKDKASQQAPPLAKGEADDAFESAPVKVDHVYRTPYEHHHPMEAHSIVVIWDGDHVTLHDSSQNIFAVRQTIAHAFSIPRDNVHILSPFVGGAFGSKGSSWPHVLIAAIAGHEVKRPVKLWLPRKQLFFTNGHRPETEQRVALGATPDGKLVSVIHEGISQSNAVCEYNERFTRPTREMYATPHMRVQNLVVELNVSSPTYMRAPGENPGMFALESAMDELATALKMDPLQLRLVNYAEHDPSNGKPWSSKSLKECYAQASDRFGWSKRNAEPRSMRAGRWLIGQGMASATYPAHRSPASCRARMNADGTAVLFCGSHEMGMGTATVMSQLAAATLGIPAERVRFEYGDTNLPQAPISAGSMTAASVGTAVYEASTALKKKLTDLNNGADVTDYATLLHAHYLPSVEVQVDSKPDPESEKYSSQAFGCHFAEVAVDPDLGIVRLQRMVSAFAGGRILNEKTAHSQLLGGIVMGIGMALSEETHLDRRNGSFTNVNFAEYLVPVNADVRNIDVILVPEEDPHVNPIGAKGLGEIGIVGVAPAIANAVYHATGKRVRDLPITLDKLL
ncbi:MAG TPA: xanthine dehydrogenase family protein molybdopterin-binding subunit [Thermoanaerobaculia bacterium]|nr:xanthine dehydrogenase family protein molybdopterin-binding subunit [Thermoanaerobaculia bacterium]